MNGKALLTVVMLSALALIGVRSASAQDRVHASIPFQFNVGAKVLPAGDYEVKRLNLNTVAIQNMDTREAALAITMATAPQKSGGEASLVFNRYGRDSFLSEILMRHSGRALAKSKLERRTAARSAESAENGPAPRVISVAASLQ